MSSLNENMKEIVFEEAKMKANETKAVWILYPEESLSTGWDFMSLNEWTENRHKVDGEDVEFVYPY